MCGEEGVIVPCVCAVLHVVNKLAMEKFDILWLASGDMYKMKKEVTAQLWNKVGTHIPD